MTLKIAIAGAAGRMGQALVRIAAERADRIAIVGGSERAGSEAVGRALAPGAVIFDSTAKAAAIADVWIDFTTPEATLAALDQLANTNVRAAIVGTTGLAPIHDQKIAAHAKRIAIVKSGNYSLGVNLLLGLIEQAGKRLGADWDIEISEMHHRRKVDAPSGTALMMGEAAASTRGQKLNDVRVAPYDGQTGPRKPGAITFAVTRGGGVIGDHEIKFISDEEIVSIGHHAIDRALFARGALEAAEWAAKQKPGLYTMRDVLAL
jgi:4-hydroxy-tetrahydrodipicolinate reductase